MHSFMGGGKPLCDSMPRKRHIGECRVIGLVVNTFIKPHRDIMLGWMRYGRIHPDVELRLFFASVATTTENLLEFSRMGVHALVLCGLQEDTVVDFVKACRPDMPIVICAHSQMEGIDLNLMPKVGFVLVDNAAIGRHVGEFFLAHGLENFGFIAMNINRENSYGQLRCAAFRAAVMSCGKSGGLFSRTFSEKIFGVCKPNGDSWDMSLEDIVEWVKSLRLPCGVFANGDRSAAVFIDACDRLGIDVPGQVEVVSVNNSYGICEKIGTTISSIQPDFDEFARLSIDMALKFVESAPGLSDGERKVLVPDHSLIERSSSLSGRGYGKIVTMAKEFIRKNACSGISVTDVAKHLGVSRRTLEMRVKFATGGSILELIRNVRFKNICRLLKTTDLSVSEVIIRSGYNLTSNVGIVFKKTYGMTMRQYRVRNAKKSIAQ